MAPNYGEGNVRIDNARLVFRNFAGREGQYNREGDRSFCIFLDQPLAQQMEDAGWNIKTLRARDEGDEDRKYVQVSVRYPSNGNRVRPPTIVLITSRGRTDLAEDMCGMIDDIDIAVADVLLRPYSWSVNGNSGVKAYLKSLYVTMAEDELAIRYRDVPEIGANDIPAIESGNDEGPRALTTAVSDDDDVWDVE